MEVPRLHELRIYYNTHIRPELVRMERLRKRTLLRITASVLGVLAVVVIALIIKLGFLVLILATPFVFYLVALYFRIERFRQQFKPNVISLILDFMNQAPNFQELSYDAKQSIGKDRFDRSELFVGRSVSYAGEDYIKGLVGEMAFELSELYVEELSRGSNRLNLIFGGIFIHALFNEPTVGHVVVWPRDEYRFMRRTIKEFIYRGGMDAEVELHNPRFRELFLVYAKKGTVVHNILTQPMQDALVRFVETTGHELYFSVHNKNVFAGISHDRDLLEPNILRSNLSFELIQEFYTDIMLMLGIIQDFDQTH